MLATMLSIGSFSARRMPGLASHRAALLMTEIASFRQVEWPQDWPFADDRYFSRTDESSDSIFYGTPRFVQHIDEGAIGAITDYYSTLMKDGDSVCDLCSSWISHLPAGMKFARVAGLGMNWEELSQNSQLTEFVVQDLNAQTKLPYDDESFDFVCNVVRW